MGGERQQGGYVRWVPKGWGGERIFANIPPAPGFSGYCGKLLYVIAGHGCSYHYHKIKDETFYVVAGTVRLYYSPVDRHPARLGNSLDDAHVVELVQGRTFHVPPLLRHRFFGETDAIIAEASSYDDPADTYRLAPGD